MAGRVDPYPKLIATVLDSTNARLLANFWRSVLGYVYAEGDEEPPAGEADTRGNEWLVLNDTAGQPRLAIQQVDELQRPTWPNPSVPQQLHLDLLVATIDELASQHERVVSLGASVLENRSDDPLESLIVFADPAGHPFCIIVSPNHA